MNSTGIDKNNRREIFGWLTYDWANSAFFTTVVTVLAGPYLTALAQADAEGRLTDDLPYEVADQARAFLEAQAASLQSQSSQVTDAEPGPNEPGPEEEPA